MTPEQIQNFNNSFDTVSAKVKEYIKPEFDEGRLNDTKYAEVIARSVDSIVNSSLGLELQSAQIELIKEETKGKAYETQIKKYQLEVLLPDEHIKNQKQIDLLDKQIELQEAEIEYTKVRTEVVKESRIDNLVIEGLKSYQDKISSLGNGGMVVSANDFSNEYSLIDLVLRRAKGQEVPQDLELKTATTYTKA